MANGCGVCDVHGAGCGAQAGVVIAWMPAGRVIPGSGARPAGLPIPLLKGVKEPPTGLTNGSMESEPYTVLCAFREVVRSGKLVAAVTGTAPGLSNC